MADGGGTGSSGSWWNSLTNSRKKNKEAAGGAQPASPACPGEPAPPSGLDEQFPGRISTPVSSGAPAGPQARQVGRGEIGQQPPKLKISRSGRFKEEKSACPLLPEESGPRRKRSSLVTPTTTSNSSKAPRLSSVHTSSAPSSNPENSDPLVSSHLIQNNAEASRFYCPGN